MNQGLNNEIPSMTDLGLLWSRVSDSVSPPRKSEYFVLSPFLHADVTNGQRTQNPSVANLFQPINLHETNFWGRRTIASTRVGTDNGTKEVWLIFLNSRNNFLAGYGGIHSCSHILHGLIADLRKINKQILTQRFSKCHSMHSMPRRRKWTLKKPLLCW